MGTVHRNGIPPKRLLWKKVQNFSDMQFNEDAITDWAREALDHHMQYNIVVFNGSKGKLNRTVEFTAWFQTKDDAERFQEKWMK